MNDQFFKITNPWKQKYYYGKVTNYIPGLRKKLLLGDYSDKVFPEIKIMSGTKEGDFMFTGALTIICISEQVIKAFEEYSISGWKLYDVVVMDKKGKSIDGYYGLSVTARINHFDTDTAYNAQKTLKPFGKKLPIQKGLKLNLSEWDGSDFFVMENKSYVFVSSKVAEVFKKFRFTNVELERIEDIQIPILES